MQFREALKTIREHSSADLPPCRILLITGFNPLHLQTFLHGHAQRLLPTKRIVVSTGLYGDLAGTMFRIQASTVEMCAIALEWPDLDPRLGFRQLGGWGPRELADILSAVESKLIAIKDSLAAVPEHVPIALSLPTLALPPVFHTPSGQLCEAEIRLRHAVSEFALGVSRKSNIRLVNTRCEQINGASAQAFDFKGELVAGLPYETSHADRMGHLLAQILVPAQPKKGLITDLDDTLWAGIAGEIGPEEVAWDLAGKAQFHGLYQQLLRALAEQGALIGVASKNDPDIVEAVFRRTDFLLPADLIFPVEAAWSSKSESVAKILHAWNVAADSVVFVDDSSSEVAEVKAAHPDMECVLFDARDYGGIHSLLYRLRDLFAKQIITEEDGIRRQSLRSESAVRGRIQQAGESYENFLREAGSKITFDFNIETNPRTLELVNKTNQFNLNGIRYTESEWHNKLNTPGSFVLTVRYCDKYGPLGVIAVLSGLVDGVAVTVTTWVMSCRAFGRRIEHQCLRLLLERFSAQEIWMEFSLTSRNEYLREFSEYFLGQKPEGPFKILRTVFLEKCPMLYHQVEIDRE